MPGLAGVRACSRAGGMGFECCQNGIRIAGGGWALLQCGAKVVVEVWQAEPAAVNGSSSTEQRRTRRPRRRRPRGRRRALRAIETGARARTDACVADPEDPAAGCRVGGGGAQRRPQMRSRAAVHGRMPHPRRVALSRGCAAQWDKKFVCSCVISGARGGYDREVSRHRLPGSFCMASPTLSYAVSSYAQEEVKAKRVRAAQHDVRGRGTRCASNAADAVLQQARGRSAGRQPPRAAHVLERAVRRRTLGDTGSQGAGHDVRGRRRRAAMIVRKQLPVGRVVRPSACFSVLVHDRGAHLGAGARKGSEGRVVWQQTFESARVDRDDEHLVNKGDTISCPSCAETRVARLQSPLSGSHADRPACSGYSRQGTAGVLLTPRPPQPDDPQRAPRRRSNGCLYPGCPCLPARCRGPAN
jgi:hypothetical protein